MNCPRCIEKMAETNSSGIPTNTCHYCNGIWLTHDSLKILLNKELSAPKIGDISSTFHLQREGGITRTCPECIDTQLEIIYAHDIELDFCPNCNGLFFDEGEIKAIFPYSHKPEDKESIGAYVATEGLFWIIVGFFGGGC